MQIGSAELLEPPPELVLPVGVDGVSPAEYAVKC